MSKNAGNYLQKEPQSIAPINQSVLRLLLWWQLHTHVVQLQPFYCRREQTLIWLIVVVCQLFITLHTTASMN